MFRRDCCRLVVFEGLVEVVVMKVGGEDGGELEIKGDFNFWTMIRSTLQSKPHLETNHLQNASSYGVAVEQNL
jgi:hypothetical protein